MGMTVDIAFEGTETSILLADAVAASIEVCFATAFELKIHPHTERFSITIVEDVKADKASFDIDEGGFAGKIIWPQDKPFLAYEKEGERIPMLMHVALGTLAATCVLHEGMKAIDQLTDDEAVLERVSAIATTGNSHNRLFGRYVSRMSDWNDVVRNTYLPREARPTIVRQKFSERDEDDQAKDAPAEKAKVWPKMANHRDVGMRSVIDYHLWNQAGWYGAAYTQLMPRIPPGIALIFKNDEAARSIFQRWQERFGRFDKDEEIYLSIVRDVSDKHPMHYAILISSNPNNAAGVTTQPTMFLSRIHRMEATTDTHIRQFLSAFESAGAFLLMPAFIENGEPKPLFNLAILKRQLTVKSAKSIGPNDIEQCAIGPKADAYFDEDE